MKFLFIALLAMLSTVTSCAQKEKKLLSNCWEGSYSEIDGQLQLASEKDLGWMWLKPDGSILSIPERKENMAYWDYQEKQLIIKQGDHITRSAVEKVTDKELRLTVTDTSTKKKIKLIFKMISRDAFEKHRKKN